MPLVFQPASTYLRKIRTVKAYQGMRNTKKEMKCTVVTSCSLLESLVPPGLQSHSNRGDFPLLPDGPNTSSNCTLSDPSCPEVFQSRISCPSSCTICVSQVVSVSSVKVLSEEGRRSSSSSSWESFIGADMDANRSRNSLW
jgi:hypothetical protein